MRLSTTKREQLYDAEAAKAMAEGRGRHPICVHCDGPVEGGRMRWDVAHDPGRPRWMGGDVVGIAHSSCNQQHNHQHDTPLYAKWRRLRQRNIGATRSLHPLPGGRDDRLKKKISGEVVLR